MNGAHEFKSMNWNEEPRWSTAAAILVLVVLTPVVVASRLHPLRPSRGRWRPIWGWHRNIAPARGEVDLPAYRTMLIVQAGKDPNKAKKCPVRPCKVVCVDLTRQMLWVPQGKRGKASYAASRMRDRAKNQALPGVDCAGSRSRRPSPTPPSGLGGTAKRRGASPCPRVVGSDTQR